jgi:hypothetical protein
MPSQNSRKSTSLTAPQNEPCVEKNLMKMQQLHEDTFHNILWNNESRVIGLDWKEGTSSMTGEDFEKEMTLFADHTAAATHREWI